MNISLSIILIFVSIIIGYLLGSISFGVLIGKVFFKKDIRNEGSHNSGGTNAGRVLGKKVGLIVILLDVLKTVIAMWSVFFIFKYAISNGTLFMDPTYYAYIAGFSCCIGHTFPLFASFHGGKAVSCYAGLLISINWLLTLIGFIFFMIFLKIKKYVSLASMVTTFFISLIAFIPYVKYGMDFGMVYDIVLPCFLLFMAFFVLIRHKENIKRLLKGTERKITWM